MTDPVSAAPDGARVELRVLPRSQPAGLAGQRAGRLLVRVGAAPVDGAANQAVRALLATAFDVPKGAVRIVAGETSRNKRVVIAGRTPEQIRQRLARD